MRYAKDRKEEASGNFVRHAVLASSSTGSSRLPLKLAFVVKDDAITALWPLAWYSAFIGAADEVFDDGDGRVKPWRRQSLR